MEIEMDLVSDFQNILINEINAIGLQYSDDISKESLIIKYFTYLRKKGGHSPRRRRVHISNEFECPQELLEGYTQLTNVMEQGRDIAPYLSKRVDNISHVDYMFNDWEVLHLHLGNQFDTNNERFIARTGPLLFLHLTPDNAYFINIYNHGDWTDRSILQIMYDNWPELIQPFILKDVMGLAYQYNEKQHQQLRKSGVVVFHELQDANGDKIVIAPPGLGMTLSTDPIKDVRFYQHTVNNLQDLEGKLRTYPKLIIESFAGDIPTPVLLKLVRESDTFFIIEESTRGRISIPNVNDTFE